MKNSYISELSGLMRRPYTLIKINFQRIRRLFWQVYLETLWNSANLPKNFTCLQLVLKQSMTRPEACNFEKLTQYSLHKQEGLGIVAKICFHYERDLSELITFYSP